MFFKTIMCKISNIYSRWNNKIGIIINVCLHSLALAPKSEKKMMMGGGEIILGMYIYWIVISTENKVPTTVVQVNDHLAEREENRNPYSCPGEG